MTKIGFSYHPYLEKKVHRLALLAAPIRVTASQMKDLHLRVESWRVIATGNAVEALLPRPTMTHMRPYVIATIKEVCTEGILVRPDAITIILELYKYDREKYKVLFNVMTKGVYTTGDLKKLGMEMADLKIILNRRR